MKLQAEGDSSSPTACYSLSTVAKFFAFSINRQYELWFNELSLSTPHFLVFRLSNPHRLGAKLNLCSRIDKFHCISSIVILLAVIPHLRFLDSSKP